MLGTSYTWKRRSRHVQLAIASLIFFDNREGQNILQTITKNLEESIKAFTSSNEKLITNVKQLINENQKGADNDRIEVIAFRKTIEFQAKKLNEFMDDLTYKYGELDDEMTEESNLNDNNSSAELGQTLTLDNITKIFRKELGKLNLEKNLNLNDNYIASAAEEVI